MDNHIYDFLFFLQGKLPDGRIIAVKQLSQTSHQGKSQFVTEVATISAVQHRNLVKLYGCCIDSNTPLLVYEYHENRSLDRALFGVLTLTDQHHNMPLTAFLVIKITFLKVLFLNGQVTVA